jgi:hypothetical protein
MVETSGNPEESKTNNHILNDVRLRELVNLTLAQKGQAITQADNQSKANDRMK